MTYASIILPYDYKKAYLNANPKTKESLKGKLTSAAHSGKNFLENAGKVYDVLGDYMQTAEETICKFSGIALAQMLANGKVTNQAALDYLFLGFASAMDQQAISMGYSGATQMKDAIANGTINIGSFVSGFSKTLKGITDYRIGQKNKNDEKSKYILELDVTLNYNEQYQSESPDRRVENGISYQEVLHNLPEIFSLECGLQDGRRYSVTDFKAYLTQLRDSKTVFSMTIGDEQLDNLVLQNFNPSVVGARSGLDYTLELKKIHAGSVELTPITIEPLDVNLYTENDKNGRGIGKGAGNITTPNYVDNPIDDMFKGPPKNMNMTPMYYFGVELPGANK